jgi:hypothetical protein
MCNLKLLAMFLSMCLGYYQEVYPPIPRDLNPFYCVKALDICVDRKTKYYSNEIRVAATVSEIENFALQECDYDISARSLAGEYYTDISCGYESWPGKKKQKRYNL